MRQINELFILLVLLVAFLAMGYYCGLREASCPPVSHVSHWESINTIADMREWMLWDIEEGRIDTTRGLLYIEAFGSVLEDLRE